MPRTVNTKPYFVINLVFAIIIAGVFLYAVVHHPEKSDYPVKSSYETVTGEHTISTGLSRSFSSIMRLDLSSAKSYNPYGIQIFMYFLVQLVLRLAILFLVLRQGFIHHRMLILADSFQAAALFVICFWPFLVFWARFISGNVT